MLLAFRISSGVFVAARTQVSSGNEVPLSGDVIHAVNNFTVRSVDSLRVLVDDAKAHTDLVLQIDAAPAAVRHLPDLLSAFLSFLVLLSQVWESAARAGAPAAVPQSKHALKQTRRSRWCVASVPEGSEGEWRLLASNMIMNRTRLVTRPWESHDRRAAVQR